MLSILLFSLFIFGAVAKQGDTVVPRACTNVAPPGYGDIQACVTLRESMDCGLEVEINVLGETIKQNLATSVSGQTCDYFSVGGQDCQICTGLVEEPNDLICLEIQPACGLFPFPTKRVNCFAKSRLDSVKKCDNNSNKQVDAAHFDQCIDMYPGITEPLCAKVSFDAKNCLVNSTIHAGTEILHKESFPVTHLRGRLQDETNCISTAGCSACLKWHNLTINATAAHGCGQFTLTCYGVRHHTEELGCFEQDDLAQCFHGCVNQCSGRGDCVENKCQCQNQWSGADCSVPPPKKQEETCKVTCDLRYGTCVGGTTCVCDDEHTGEGCVEAIKHTDVTNADNQDKGTSNGHAALIGVGVAVGILALAALAFVGVYIYHKRKSGQPQFTRLDLIDDNME